jgi:hypothetical protein
MREPDEIRGQAEKIRGALENKALVFRVMRSADKERMR